MHRLCVTLVDLERIPPFRKFTEKGQQRENGTGPLRGIQLQALEWAEHSPGHQISPEIPLAEKANTCLAGLCSPRCMFWAFYSLTFFPPFPIS